LKGGNRDDYPLPAAHYEMAVLAWVEVQNPALRKTANEADGDQGLDENEWRRKKTDECESWLDTVSKWEAYILDARFGMRLNTGLDTIKWYRREHGWAAV
jgi:hypothetical protein